VVLFGPAVEACHFDNVHYNFEKYLTCLLHNLQDSSVLERERERESNLVLMRSHLHSLSCNWVDQAVPPWLKVNCDAIRDIYEDSQSRKLLLSKMFAVHKRATAGDSAWFSSSEVQRFLHVRMHEWRTNDML
jgi:hypothetical protein